MMIFDGTAAPDRVDVPRRRDMALRGRWAQLVAAGAGGSGAVSERRGAGSPAGEQACPPQLLHRVRLRGRKYSCDRCSAYAVTPKGAARLRRGLCRVAEAAALWGLE
eukprot:8722730-Pyramimonas_sp.AAC.1